MMTDKPTYADWKPLADKEVKGRDLTWHTAEGIAVKPLYTSADTSSSSSIGRWRGCATIIA